MGNEQHRPTATVEIGGDAQQTLESVLAVLLAAIAKLAGLAAAAIPGEAVSVTNASATIAAANAARRALVITNMSQIGYLTIKLGSTAVAGKGIILSPSPDNAHPGGTCIIDGKDYAGIVTGILSAADATPGNIAISEA